MKTFKTGILGFGRHGGGLQMDEIVRNPSFTLTAVCDIDPERFAKIPALDCRTYLDYREMLERENLDIVVIATRSDQHCEMTCDCLAAGINVMVTKPWALNVAEAQRMITTARTSNGTLYPWLPSFWSSDVIYLKKQLAENSISEPFVVRLAVSSFSTRDDWQMYKKYGGGYLLNWGPHLVLKAVIVAGGLHNVKSVYANMRNVIHPGDTEDVFAVTLKMLDGTLVFIERTVAPLEHSWWVVQADRGMITILDDEATVISMPRYQVDITAVTNRATEEKTESKALLEKNYLYGNTHAIYEALAAAMRGEKEFPVTLDDAMQLTRILDAIRDASESNRVIELV